MGVSGRLQEFEHLFAVHDSACSGGDVLTDDERVTIDLGGHAAVENQVVDEIAGAAHRLAPAGFNARFSAVGLPGNRLIARSTR